MAHYNMYPTNLSDDEVALGFQSMLIPNERSDYFGQPNLIGVVAYEIGPMDLVIKVRDSAGNIEYSHRQFSDYGPGDDPGWNPVLTTNPHAEAAIRSAQHRIDEEIARRSGLNLDPSFPCMEVVCPSCSHEMSLKRAFLLVSEEVTCKACNRSTLASGLVRYDA
jgi:hypothetical protein